MSVKGGSVPLILTNSKESCHMDMVDKIQYPGHRFSRLSLILGHFPWSKACKM